MDLEQAIQRMTEILSKRPKDFSAAGISDLRAYAQEQLQQGLAKIRETQAEMEALAARAAEPAPPTTAPAAATPSPPPAPPTPPPPLQPIPDGPLALVQGDCTAEIVQRYSLEPAAQALRKEPQSPREFLDALLHAGLRDEAIRFLAFGLGKPVAVLWGALCADWVTPAAQLPAAEAAALAAALRWVLKPTEELCRAVEAAARSAGAHTPAGCLAQAVFCAGPSLADPSLPPVPPPPYLANQLAYAAIRIALGRAPAQQAADTLHHFLVMGVWIAVHGPLAPRPANHPSWIDVRGRIHDLYLALHLLPAGRVTQSDTSQEVWEYLQSHADSGLTSGIRRPGSFS